MDEFYFEEKPDYYKEDCTITVKGKKGNKNFKDLKRLLQFETIESLIKKLKKVIE